jgi:hypothetical protein
VPRLYNGGQLPLEQSLETAVRRVEVVASQLPFSEDVSTEAEDIVGIHYHAMTGEDIANWEDFMYAIVTVFFGV